MKGRCALFISGRFTFHVRVFTRIGTSEAVNGVFQRHLDAILDVRGPVGPVKRLFCFRQQVQIIGGLPHLRLEVELVLGRRLGYFVQKVCLRFVIHVLQVGFSFYFFQFQPQVMLVFSLVAFEKVQASSERVFVV